jgi:hypothetical protein
VHHVTEFTVEIQRDDGFLFVGGKGTSLSDIPTGVAKVFFTAQDLPASDSDIDEERWLHREHCISPRLHSFRTLDQCRRSLVDLSFAFAILQFEKRLPLPLL